MVFSDELLFFFSALGSFNALLISLYFFFVVKPKHISNFFFGFLLLMLTIRVVKSVFYFFNKDLSQIFIRIGLCACLLIGPSLYFYFKSQLLPNHKLRLWKFHFLILFLLSILINSLFLESHNPIVLGFSWMNIIYFIWLIYIIASGFVLRFTISKIFKKDRKISDLDFWILSIFIGNFIIWLAYRMVGYISYIAGALSFSFILYLLFILIYFKRKNRNIFNKSTKYSHKKIDKYEVHKLSEKLIHLMEKERIYTTTDLKLSEVAAKMGIPAHILSQLINDNLNKSFTQFINEYRICEAKKMISSNSSVKLEGIGYDCGFNSKSAFYSVFKKITGTTPSKFKETTS